VVSPQSSHIRAQRDRALREPALRDARVESAAVNLESQQAERGTAHFESAENHRADRVEVFVDGSLRDLITM
jgi:hypothetical protein